MFSSNGTFSNNDYKNLKGSGSDLPTAVKSFYQQISPTHPDISRSFRVPSRYDSQFRDVKHSLNYIIDQVSDKNKTANYGVEKVRETNKEALRFLNQNNSYLASTPKRIRYKKDYKTQGIKTTSPTACLSPSQFDGGFTNPFNKGQQPDHQVDNYELKKLLNDEIRKNNELMKELSVVKEENALLKTFRRNKTIPSTIYQELAQLKRQNERLRQNTIRLLDTPHY